METISGQNVTVKKGNKENSGPKSFIKRGVPKTTSATSVPLHPMNNKSDGQVGDTVKKAKTGPKTVTASLPKKPTLSQAFLTSQAVRHRKLIDEAPKPPATVASKPALGTYKGRVVQSKIGAIWKSSTTSLEGGSTTSLDRKAALSMPKVEKKGDLAKTKSTADLPRRGAPKPIHRLPSQPKSVTDGPFAVPKYPAPRARVDTQKNGDLTKARSKSVADLPRRGAQKPLHSVPTRSKSVADGPLPVPKVPAPRRAISSQSVGQSSKVASSGTLARPSSSKSAMVATGKESQSNKPKEAVTVNKVRKPVSSTLSQYRTSQESAEERRAKLSEWLLSKGKTLKRPPISTTAPAAPAPKAKPVKESEVHPTPQLTEQQSSVEPQSAVQSDPEPQPGVQTTESNPASPPEEGLEHEEKTALAATPMIMNTTLELVEDSSMDQTAESNPGSPPEDNQGAEKTASAPTPLIMNTTLDLLENSSMDLPVDPEAVNIEEVIVNLCDALEASSLYADDSIEVGEESEPNVKSENVESGEAIRKEEEDGEEEDGEGILKEEESGEEEDGEGMVKEEEDGEGIVKEEDDEEGIVKKANMSYDEIQSDEEGYDDLMKTPEMEGASMVKYSVKTTPYLQSVKKTIDNGASGSKRNSAAIKDLKFLTPVRRSCRIQRNSSVLPEMLTDHDPCVSSLAELVQMDDDANAYIYRKNPALLEELPDHPKDLERI